MQCHPRRTPDLTHPVTTWQPSWSAGAGLHNFLMGGELTACFDYQMPPLERIVAEVRADPRAVVRSGVKVMRST